MRRVLSACVAWAVMLSGLTSPLLAREIRWDGLGGVAVSPDGGTIAVGGLGRTLYLLDAKTYEVKQRAYLGYRVGPTSFNKDGSRIVVESGSMSSQVLRIDAKTLKILKAERPASRAGVAVAPMADVMATIQKEDDYLLRVDSMTTGKTLSRIPLPETMRSAIVTLSADGKQAVVWSRDKNDEQRVDFKDRPKDLKGLDLDAFNQKHDEYGYTVMSFDLTTGKQTASFKSWYSSFGSGVHAVLRGGELVVIQYGDVNARIDLATQEVKLFNLHRYGYGLGSSPDGKTIISGGLARGAILHADGKVAKFNVPNDQRLEGWPEYFERFTIGPDGRIYGVTGAYRLWVMSPDGKVERIVPVN